MDWKNIKDELPATNGLYMTIDCQNDIGITYFKYYKNSYGWEAANAICEDNCEADLIENIKYWAEIPEDIINSIPER